MDLTNRHLLTLKDYSSDEINYLLQLSAKVKSEKKAQIQPRRMLGKNIVLVFEKTSTRTRCAFEVAAFDEGAGVTFLTNSQMGKKESIFDTARVLGRYYDGIEFRGFKQQTVEALAEHAGVPVWNGLTDLYHPTQILADVLTITEHVNKPLNKIKLIYTGDVRNNVANSLLIGAAKLGMHYVGLAPQGLQVNSELLTKMQEESKRSGAVLEFTDNIAKAVKNADVIYTDTWVSMGEENLFAERINLLKPYQVNQEMMDMTDNPDVIFMHCLPANHNTETEVGKMVYEQYGLGAMEVTNEVFYSKNSVVFDQAENRMHTIKAVMLASLGLF